MLLMQVLVKGLGGPIKKTNILNSKFNMRWIKYNRLDRADLSHKISTPPATPVFTEFTPLILNAFLAFRTRQRVLVHDSFVPNGLDRLGSRYTTTRTFYAYREDLRFKKCKGSGRDFGVSRKRRFSFR